MSKAIILSKHFQNRVMNNKLVDVIKIEGSTIYFKYFCRFSKETKNSYLTSREIQVVNEKQIDLILKIEDIKEQMNNLVDGYKLNNSVWNALDKKLQVLRLQAVKNLSVSVYRNIFKHA